MAMSTLDALLPHVVEFDVYKGPTPDIGDLSCYRARPGLILSEWDLSISERIAIMRGANIELGVYSWWISYDRTAEQNCPTAQEGGVSWLARSPSSGSR